MAAFTADNIGKAIASCADRYLINRAYLFGSHARGEADAESDIDICIEHDPGFTLFTLGGLGKHLETVLGASVDIVCGEETFYPRAKQRYLEDRVLVYERG